MLTFEKVLEIFADYLTADETIEVYISGSPIGLIKNAITSKIAPFCGE